MNGDLDLSDVDARERSLANEAEVARAARVAMQAREGAMAGFMSMTMTELFGVDSATGFKAYRDRLLADCGLDADGDPIAVMLVEQLAIAHLNVGRLHAKAALVDGHEAVRAYVSAAVQLAGEFRRGASALKAYREPNLPRVVVDDEDLVTHKPGRRRTGT